MFSTSAVKPTRESQTTLRQGVLCVILLLPCVILLFGPSVAFAAWQDWFRTPEQQAAQLLENGDAKTLIEKAPSDSWKGHGHFQAGELDAATTSFEQARKFADESGDSEAVQRALFNLATTNVHNGRIDEAISQFDELLELNPDHESALHNKQLAEKIREQQEPQQQSGGDGEQGGQTPDSASGEQQGGQQQDGEQGDGQKDGQDGQPNESGDRSDPSADGSPSKDDSTDARNASAGDSATAEEQYNGAGNDDAEENSEAAARAALDAERKQSAQPTQPSATDESDSAELDSDESDSDSDERGTDESTGTVVEESDQPLTEQQQATEQWLRQIPDDPAGLLRNKLQQSHRLEYPGVQSSEERW